MKDKLPKWNNKTGFNGKGINARVKIVLGDKKLKEIYVHRASALLQIAKKENLVDELGYPMGKYKKLFEDIVNKINAMKTIKSTNL